MSLIHHSYTKRTEKFVLEETDFYERDWTLDSIRQWQLNQFNLQWQGISSNVPYFQQLTTRNHLPAKFSTWDEVKGTLPFLDRKTIQKDLGLLIDKTKNPQCWRSTGGSTGEPLQIPIWKSEALLARKDLWLARSWFDVKASDKLFLIWGHSHLLGTGWPGRLNALKRRLKDAYLGYYRWSAYNLTEVSLRAAAEALLQFRPSYLIAYAVALDRFARVNQHLKADFHQLALKVAIATAESFPKSNSADFVSDVLGCPVVMEYGAVETGPIAHQRPDRKYSVFWRRYFLETQESRNVAGAHEIYVTSLYPRCIPLVRYKLGDLLLTNDDENPVLQFDAVIGRCNDFVILKNGSVIHSEAFTHVVKDFSSILGYQVVQAHAGNVSLKYVATKPLPVNELDEIRRRLNQIHPGLENICIERAELLENTIAGKTIRIVRQEPGVSQR